ncbi:hypothetical protein AVEN_48665-1 [Araneus ventricosus]|uniref:Uncharacterized protein n=1 Tax=Araneus ventricosus TaxID=182803 RepID=A0A4Y2U4R4_ARAVE|nr:hypothetical protein AVEN_48665-1 [Araneus ventricosus]
MSACELLNGPSLIWAFGTDVPLVYRFRLYGTQLYASPGPAIELLMTGNKLPGLTSLISNCMCVCTRTGMETTSWIHGLNMSTGNCLLWYSLCGSMERLQLA